MPSCADQMPILRFCSQPSFILVCGRVIRKSDTIGVEGPDAFGDLNGQEHVLECMGSPLAHGTPRQTVVPSRETRKRLKLSKTESGFTAYNAFFNYAILKKAEIACKELCLVLTWFAEYRLDAEERNVDQVRNSDDSDDEKHPEPIWWHSKRS